MESGVRVSLHHVATSHQELPLNMTAQQLFPHPPSPALTRQDWLLGWAWGPEKGSDSRLQRTRMRAPIKAESQSEVVIRLRLLLAREDTTGLVRSSQCGRGSHSQIKIRVSLLLESLLQAAPSSGPGKKHRLSGTEGDKSSHPKLWEGLVSEGKNRVQSPWGQHVQP